MFRHLWRRWGSLIQLLLVWLLLIFMTFLLMHHISLLQSQTQIILVLLSRRWLHRWLLVRCQVVLHGHASLRALVHVRSRHEDPLPIQKMVLLAFAVVLVEALLLRLSEEVDAGHHFLIWVLSLLIWNISLELLKLSLMLYLLLLQDLLLLHNMRLLFLIDHNMGQRLLNSMLPSNGLLLTLQAALCWVLLSVGRRLLRLLQDRHQKRLRFEVLEGPTCWLQLVLHSQRLLVRVRY